MNGQEAVNWATFGKALSDARREAGYRTVPAFQKAVESASGLSVSAVTIRKIEKGRQEPRVSELMAFSLTLFGGTYAEKMDTLLSECICEKWQLMDGEHHRLELEKFLNESMALSVESSLTMGRINQAEAVYKKKLSLASKAFDSVALDESSTQEQVEAALAEFEETSKKVLEEFEEAIQKAL